MYQAKRNGEFYSLRSDQGTSGQALRRMKLGSDLKRAIEREEFKVCYQPEVVLENGRRPSVWRRWYAESTPSEGCCSPPSLSPLPKKSG